MSGMVVSLVGDMGGSPAGGRGEEPVWAALAVCVAPVVWAGAAAGDGIPAGGCADTCRRPGECNGYTWRSPA
ncbi:MAG: hypothetical protein ACLSV7_08040 [Oscillospiraceae bacterium]